MSQLEGISLSTPPFWRVQLQKEQYAWMEVLQHTTFIRGTGSGANNWLIHLQGGGWCDTISNCQYCAADDLSSKKIPSVAYFKGVLSNDSQLNLDFYNWNLVKVRYCDG